jgi:hypothetical protein
VIPALTCLAVLALGATLIAALVRALRRPRRLELWEVVERDLRHDGWWCGGDAQHTVTAVRRPTGWYVHLARYSGYELVEAIGVVVETRDEVVEAVRRWSDG